jgi:hypothetical protein
VLGQQFVDVDERLDRVVLLQFADDAGRGVRLFVDAAEFLAGEQRGEIADRRVFRHAAPEMRFAGFVHADFAHQVHHGDRPIALLLGEGRQVQGDFGNHADKLGPAAVDHHELRDGGPGVVGHVEAGCEDAHGGGRTAHRDDFSERLAHSRPGGWRTGRIHGDFVHVTAPVCTAARQT